MKWTHYIYGLVMCTVMAAMPSVANAQIINNENACIWAIANDELPIPSGKIITDAELVLYDVRSTQDNAALYIQLLDNPNVGIEELQDGQRGNFFDGYGTALSAFDAWSLSSNPKNITINLKDIDTPNCWTRDIFKTLPVITLADASTVTCSSSMLALFDYAGTGQSFGFGIDCDGVSITAITLNLTIQSTTGQVSSETVTFTTGQFNNVPVLTAISNQTVTETETLSFNIAATDSDGDTLSYSTSTLPAGAAFADQTFTWTPGYDQAGMYQIIFRVTDGIQEVSRTVTITVLDNNRPPVLAPIGDKTVAENQTLSFLVSAIDPDGNAVVLNADNLPAGADFANGKFTWTPSYEQSGTYQMTFSASDNLLMDSETVTLTVENTNRPPVLGQIADQTVSATQTTSFTVSSSDPDGDTVTLSAQNLPAGADFQNGTFTWSPTNQQAGTYEVTITANDGNGGTDSITVSITVEVAASEWKQLVYDDFENGLGSYTSGGRDCRLYSGTKYAHQGTYAANIQDNSGTLSSFYLTNGVDLSGYSEVKIEFWYMPVSMDNSNEDFRLDYWNGSQWITLKTWAQGTDFQNNVFYSETVTLSQQDIAFAANAKIRFVCDASSNYDDVYIDEISISAK